MSSAIALSAVRRAAAFASGLRSAAPSGGSSAALKRPGAASSQGRQMVMARSDCLTLPAFAGGLETELKERMRQGAEQAAAAFEGAATAAVCERKVGGAPGDATTASKLALCQNLAEEALCGEARAAAGLVDLLRDTSLEVRAAALEATACLANFGPQGAVDAAASSLRCFDAGLRWRSQEHRMAVDALAARFGS